jgi:hypothetical protein
MELKTDLQKELIEGRLCEKGYLKERYDYEKEDLVRTITSKGINEIKNMLKEGYWQKEFCKLIKEMNLTNEQKIKLGKEIIDKLK